MKKYNIALYLFCLFLPALEEVFAQGSFSGDLQTNSNFYTRDTLIGAAGNPHYDQFLSGTDAWLGMNYSNWGFNFGLRFDLFNNSNLHNPNLAFSAQGVGMWYISKKINELTITGGYIYDQVGSGITFRAYEDRGLGIDNALIGLKVDYDINERWRVKGFTGKQKNRFEIYEPIIKGIDIEGTVELGEGIHLAPGASLVNRTLDDQSMNLIVSDINSRDSVAFVDGQFIYVDRFVPKYNVYSFSVYNTLLFKNFTWYGEFAGKTNEAIVGPDGDLINVPGSVIFQTLTYAVKGFGITGQFKRTENFTFRTSPNETLLKGMISFIPPMAKQNSLRLLSRYNAATQELGEMAFQGDIVYTPVKGYSLTLNFSDIKDLDNLQLFREIYFDITVKKSRKWKTISGIQVVSYNQEVYEVKPNVPMVQAITPHTEWVYKFDRRKSIRTELQYQFNQQDFGSWAYALLEFNIAPKYSFSVSDMVTTDPAKYYKKTGQKVANDKKPIHFYSVFAAYTKGANRMSIAYVKQVEGIVCTGGICRFEPAFSGIKVGLTSSF